MNLYGFFLIIFFVVTMGVAFAHGRHDEPKSMEYTSCYSGSMREAMPCMVPDLRESPFR